MSNMQKSLTQRILFSWGADVLTTVVGFIGTIYLARSLGPAPLGIFALSISVMHWLRVSDLGVTSATVKRISEGKNQSEIISAAVIIQILQTIIVVSFLILFRRRVNEYIGGEFVFFIAILFIMNRLMNGVSRQILNGYQSAHISSGLTAADRVLRTTFQVILVAVGFEVVGLFIGMGVSLGLVGSIGLVYVYLSTDFGLAIPNRQTFDRIYDYAKYSVLGVVKSEAFSWTDIVVMGFFISSSAIGVYNVSWSIAMAFLLLGTAMQRNIFPEISSISTMGNDTQTRNILSESLIYAGIFPIAGMVGAFLIGDSVLAIYGPEFTDGQYILVLLIGVALLRAYEKQIHALLDGVDRPDLTFRLNLVFTVANICLNILLVPLFGAPGAAGATILSLLINVGLGWRASTRLIDARFPVLEVGKQILAACIMGVVVLMALSLSPLPPQNILVLLIIVAVGAATYFTSLLIFSNEIRSKFQNIIVNQLS